MQQLTVTTDSMTYRSPTCRTRADQIITCCCNRSPCCRTEGEPVVPADPCWSCQRAPSTAVNQRTRRRAHCHIPELNTRITGMASRSFLNWCATSPMGAIDLHHCRTRPTVSHHSRSKLREALHYYRTVAGPGPSY